MFFKKNKELISGILIMLIGAIYFCMTFQIPIKNSKTWSSAAFPRIYGVALLVFGLIILIQALLEKKRVQTSDNKDDEVCSADNSIIYVVASFLILVVCICFMEKAGFILCSTVFLLSHFIMLGGKSLKSRLIYVLASVVISVTIYMIFVNGFGLLLPHGKIF